MTLRFITYFISLMFFAGSSMLFAEPETKSFKLNEIKKIDIDNTMGDVELVTSTNDQAVVSFEKGEKCDAKEYLLTIEQKGDTLVIKSEKKSNLSWWDKLFSESDDWTCTIHLALTVPKDVSIKYKAVSGNLSTEDLKGSLEFDVVSGDIDISGSEISSLQGKSVSGEVRVIGVTSSAQVNVVSGDIMIRYDKTPQNGLLDLKSVSGDAVIFLPPDARFTNEFSATSGELKNDFSATKDMKDAPFKISFKAVSGNLDISKIE